MDLAKVPAPAAAGESIATLINFFFFHHFLNVLITFKKDGNEVFIEFLSCICHSPPKVNAAMTLVIKTL